MTMLTRTIALALLLATSATQALAQPATPPAPPAVPSETLAENPDVAAATRLFSAWLEGQIAYRGLPGVAVGVVHDQQLVWSRGFGYADIATKKPMTEQTRFRIASNSKLFAAIAILQLREAGKLRLDDPVAMHLPWFTMKPAGLDDGPITIEQLLSHSSGLQREAGDHWVQLRLPDRGGTAETHARSPGRVSAADALEIFQPGLCGRRVGGGENHRPALGRLCAGAHHHAAGHDRHQHRQA